MGFDRLKSVTGVEFLLASLVALLVIFLMTFVVAKTLIFPSGDEGVARSEELVNPIPRVESGTGPHASVSSRIAERERISLLGLSAYFGREELAFQSDEPRAQFLETMNDWLVHGDLGLAKLEQLFATSSFEDPFWLIDTLLDSLPPEDENHLSFYRMVFRHLGTTSPGVGLSAAMDRLPENDLRLYAGGEIVEQWAYRNPDQLLSRLAEMPDQFGKDYWIYQTPAFLVESRPKELMAWIVELPEEFRSTAAQHAAIQWLARDPQSARRFSVASFPANEIDHPEFEAFCVEVGFALARESPYEAIEWLNELPQGEIWTTCLENLVAWWVDFDPENASRWLNLLPRDGEVDTAIYSFVRSAATVDPAGARHWAGEIRNQDLRDAALREIDRHGERSQ